MKYDNAVDIPKPGSKEAILDGCKCPIIDNEYGLGRGGNGFEFGWFVNEDCPLHGTQDYNSFINKEQNRSS
jgi:hypothetical protein